MSNPVKLAFAVSLVLTVCPSGTALAQSGGAGGFGFGNEKKAMAKPAGAGSGLLEAHTGIPDHATQQTLSLTKIDNGSWLLTCMSENSSDYIWVRVIFDGPIDHVSSSSVGAFKTEVSQFALTVQGTADSPVTFAVNSYADSVTVDSKINFQRTPDQISFGQRDVVPISLPVTVRFNSFEFEEEGILDPRRHQSKGRNPR